VVRRALVHAEGSKANRRRSRERFRVVALWIPAWNAPVDVAQALENWCVPIQTNYDTDWRIALVNATADYGKGS